MVATKLTSPWLLAIVASGAVAGAALGVWIAVTVDADSVWPPTLLLGFGGFLVTLVLVVGWLESRPFFLRRQVPIAANTFHDHAEQWFGRAPWILSRNDPHQLVYWRRIEPAFGVVAALLLLGVVLGILYYLWGRGIQTVAIGITPVPGGTDLEIVVHPQGSTGRNRAENFFNSLHRLVRTP